MNTRATPQAAPGEVPEQLLIIDTETTGLDPQQHLLCEIGAVLFSVADRAVLLQLSFLLPVVTNEAEAINGISPQLSQQLLPTAQAMALLHALVNQADALVAHNAGFDRGWLDPLFCSAGLPIKPWICTCEGISWEDLKPNPSLQTLALAHGVPVWSAHRALTDCIYLAQVLERTSNLEDKLAGGLLPRRLVAADLPFDRKEEAKAAGFRWQPDRKLWLRRLTDGQINTLPFPTYEVQP
jgi:DNA polymerase-3 subunit epsilon